MRLIDAEAFNDWVLSHFAEPQSALILTLQGFIAEQPTAYDIDKVAEELEENASRYTKKYTTPYGNNGYKDIKAISVKKAIEIVKQGDVSNRKDCEYRHDNGNWGNSSVADIGDILGKLAEYKALEEQGLLLRLPCKVGNTVWRIIISDNYIMPCNVEEFVYSNSLYIIVREELFNTRRGLNINEIGKTVFLTKAEAEQKLKEMESD